MLTTGDDSVRRTVSLCFRPADYIVKTCGDHRHKCLITAIARAINPVATERLQQKFEIRLQIFDRGGGGGPTSAILHPTLLLRAVAPKRQSSAEFQNPLVFPKVRSKFKFASSDGVLELFECLVAIAETPFATADQSKQQVAFLDLIKETENDVSRRRIVGVATYYLVFRISEPGKHEP